MDAVSSPLSGKYLVRNRAANRLLRTVDALLGCLWPPRPIAIRPPQRILIANGAHLGDVLLSTSVLPLVRHAFPSAAIDFLTGSWAGTILENHPLIDRVHTVDHWKLNRAAISMAAKLRQYTKSRAIALHAIRRRRYDIAIDLYFYFPNSIPLLWQAGIPVRVGYTSGGFGPMLTHALDWQMRDCHVTDYFADLIRMLAPSARLPAPRPSLAHVAPEQTALPEAPREDYVVIHMGTGSPIRRWPTENWIALVDRLHAAGHLLVFTGTSSGEKQAIAAVIRRLPSCLDWSGRLSWAEFVEVVRNARLVVGVESLAGHVAAAVDTPVVAIYSGTTHPAHWRPYGDQKCVLTAPVPCAPCYRSRGCATMDCVRGVSVDEAFQAIQEIRSARTARVA